MTTEHRSALRDLIHGAVAELCDLPPADVVGITESEYLDRGLYGMADSSGKRVTVTHRPFGSNQPVQTIIFYGSLSELILQAIS